MAIHSHQHSCFYSSSPKLTCVNICFHSHLPAATYGCTHVNSHSLALPDIRKYSLPLSDSHLHSYFCHVGSNFSSPPFIPIRINGHSVLFILMCTLDLYHSLCSISRMWNDCGASMTQCTLEWLCQPMARKTQGRQCCLITWRNILFI